MLWQGGTLKILEKELTTKGYVNILNVSKRGLKPSKVDFQEVLDQIGKATAESKEAEAHCPKILDFKATERKRTFQ